MADVQLTQTGEELQADLDKVEGLAIIKTVGTGLSLNASTGNLTADTTTVATRAYVDAAIGDAIAASY